VCAPHAAISLVSQIVDRPAPTILPTTFSQIIDPNHRSQQKSSAFFTNRYISEARANKNQAEFPNFKTVKKILKNRK